ncbi:hypothetical protein ACN28G_10450 [Micromonospora sp. WMMA1923]|uniref:hypothetical protein n=1 Tax=Micromonospora sp. WMMA1923 TaxID=3404125 RepID=UPI003B9559AC
MPVLRRLGEQTGPAAPGDAAGPALERIIGFTFDDPGVPPGDDELTAFVDHMESIHGRFADLTWLTGGTMVSYHDMVRTVVDTLGPALVDVDLVVTVEASQDCRHQSFPGSLLCELLPGDPLMMGISEQGVAGPFTALRIAHDQVAAGGARRALVVAMEQNTLPPDDAAVRPGRNLAVAMLVGPDGTMPLGRPRVARTAAPAAAGSTPPRGDVLVAGAALAAPPGRATVVRAPAGHPCLGVWLTLASLLEQGLAAGSRVVVADEDPVLPYRCEVVLTLPATPHPDTATRPGTRGSIARVGAPHPDPAAVPVRPHRRKELAR